MLHEHMDPQETKILSQFVLEPIPMSNKHQKISSTKKERSQRGQMLQSSPKT